MRILLIFRNLQDWSCLKFEDAIYVEILDQAKEWSIRVIVKAMLSALKNKIGPIWRFRQQFDEERLCGSVCNAPLHLWVARTRYDENGNRVRTGNMPFRYTIWHIARWSPLKYIDKYKAEQDPDYVDEDCVIVESDDETVTKLVNIDDLFITNYGSITDPNYDPNTDDPLHKYSHEQRKCMREEEMRRISQLDV